jgi:hypothetical protein
MKTQQQRTADLLASFQGLPGEFYMLKGVLCLPYSLDDSEQYEHYELYDRVMIARRMDELAHPAEIEA